MRVFILSANFVWNIFYSKKNWARYDKKKVYRSSCKVLPNFNDAWIFSTDFFSKNSQMWNFILNKIPVRSELFHADKRKDVAKLIVVFFRNFANARKNNKAVLKCVHKSTSKNFGGFPLDSASCVTYHWRHLHRTVIHSATHLYFYYVGSLC